MGLSWWMHVAVPAGPQGLGTITLGADASRCACSPCSVAAYTQSPGRGLRLVAGADSFTRASHPAEKPGASQQPGSEQQGLQGRVKGWCAGVGSRGPLVGEEQEP